jgi:hypothetical protein
MARAARSDRPGADPLDRDALALSTPFCNACMQAAASSILRVKAIEPFRIGARRALSWMRAFGYSCSTTRCVLATSSFSSSRAASWWSSQSTVRFCR